MGVNAGRLHGVGVRPSFEPTFSGVALNVQHPGLPGVLTALVMNCPQFSSGEALVIQDTGSGRASGVPLAEVFSAAGNEVFSIDRAGNTYVYGAQLGAGPGLFGPYLQFDGSTNPPCILATVGNNRLYFASIPPTSQATAAANANDWWYNSSGSTANTYFYSCTVGGTPGTWVGFI